MRKKLFYLIILLGLFFITGCNNEDISNNNSNNEIEVEDVTVSFETNGGSSIDSITIKKDQRINGLVTPTKFGYEFNGWYIDKECTVLFDMSTKLRDNLKLYADWKAEKLKVNVITKFDNYYIDANYGDTLNILTNPKEHGYVFKGFYLDSSYSVVLDKSQQIKSNMTVYGLFEPVKYEVNIIIDESCTTIQKFDYLSSLSLIETPTKENSIFDGFYYDEECTKKVDLETTLSNNLTIYCKWIDTLNVGYTVKYMIENVNGNGYSVHSTAELFGKLDDEVYAELKEISGTTLQSTSVSGIVSLSEKLVLEVYYSRNKYNITYYIGDNIYLDEKDIVFGAQLKIPLTCENGNSIFRGWYTDKTLTKKQNYKAMPANDVTLYAKFEEVIEGTEGLKYTLNSAKNGYIVTGYDGTSSKIIIPNGYNKLPVLQVKSLSKSSVIEEIVISNNVTAIKKTAFVGCINLKKLTLPTTLKTIDLNTFDECENLKSITIPKSVTTNLIDLFKELEFIEEINVASGHSKFYSHEGVLYSTTTKSLVLYPQGKKSVTYSLPSTAQSIDYYGFYGNKYLENVVLNDSLKSIFADAFLNCTNLKTITIGKSTSYISDAWLNNNPNLNEIIVKDTNTSFKSIDGVLFSFDETKLLNYPQNKEGEIYIISDNVNFIGYNAFNNLNYLNSLVLPESIETIDYSAMNDTDLTIYVSTLSMPVYAHKFAIKNCKVVYYSNQWKFEGDNPTLKEEE